MLLIISLTLLNDYLKVVLTQCFLAFYSAVCASKLLKERLNLLGKIGCLLCVVGSTIVVIHAPKSGEVTTMLELELKLKAPGETPYCDIVSIP